MYIRDFGILRNQTLADLHLGLVVIGGLNRAGKSTFMNVLRYLGYGFPRDGSLPPATVQYGVEADISLGNALYNLSLSGYGAPEVNVLSGRQTGQVDVRELYPLDNYTYRQLFTISLEELSSIQSLTPGAKRDLQSILLGAGLKEVTLLPQLKNEFGRQADSIGGTRGNPSVKLFKQFHQAISEGQQLRKSSQAHIHAYSTNQTRLAEIGEELESVSAELDRLGKEVRRLDLIKNNFSTYEEMVRLENELKYRQAERWEHVPSEDQLERVRKLATDCRELEEEIGAKEISIGLSTEAVTKLIARGNELNVLASGVSGIKERLRQLQAAEDRYAQQRRNLADRITKLNVNWSLADAEAISALRLDEIEKDNVNELVEKYSDLVDDQGDAKRELKRLKEEEDRIAEEIKKLSEGKSAFGLAAYGVSTLVAAVLGVLAGVFLNPLVSIVALALILVLTASYFTQLRSARSSQEMLSRRRERQEELKAERQAVESTLTELAEAEKECAAQLEQYQNALNLESEVPYKRLPSYLDQVRSLQEQITELNRLNLDVVSLGEQLDEDYRRYLEFLTELASDLPVQASGEREQDWNLLFVLVQDWQAKLAEAETLRRKERELTAKQREIGEIMERSSFSVPAAGLDEGIDLFLVQAARARETEKLAARLVELEREVRASFASDAVREAFELEDGADVLAVFKDHCKPFPAGEEAERAHAAALNKRTELAAQLGNLQDEERQVREELKRLFSQRDFEVAKQKIDHNRSELRRLAEAYALNRTAEFLLQETERTLLDQMKDSLMAGAGRIFSRITQGEYDGVEPGKNLLEEDFQAVLSGTDDRQGAAILSRGTREQLYLSVRLSRILEIEPALPIIIDDSMANFDGPHLDETLGILSEVAKRHQIFVLTCHGSLLERLSKLNSPVQYWKLERGQFALSERDDLISHLA